MYKINECNRFNDNMNTTGLQNNILHTISISPITRQIITKCTYDTELSGIHIVSISPSLISSSSLNCASSGHVSVQLNCVKPKAISQK